MTISDFLQIAYKAAEERGLAARADVTPRTKNSKPMSGSSVSWLW